MLTVISPAKAMNMDPCPDLAQTQPQFTSQTSALIARVQQLSAQDLAKLMSISDKLARLSFDRFQAMPDGETKQAAFAFNGDTYKGLEAKTLDADTLDFAQGHLRILSGLYGMLRPLDAIHAYRLEMGSRLSTPQGKDLYAFWGDTLALALNEQATAVGAQYLLNCASQEYFGAVDTAALTLPVITPRFLDAKGDAPAKIISFYAKQARGALARFALEERLQEPEALRDFTLGGYAFDPAQSTAEEPVFLRRHAD